MPLVSEILPVRVAEMVPVRVAEMVPVLVADIVPDFAWTPVEKTTANIAAHAMDLTFFIVLLLMFSNVLGNGSAQMFALLSHLLADFKISGSHPYFSRHVPQCASDLHWVLSILEPST